MTNVRRAGLHDHPRMLSVWEDAVRATHTFLDEQAIDELRPAVVAVFAEDSIQWWVATVDAYVVAFLGVVSRSVEALFIDPVYHRRGIGQLLVTHAQQLNRGESLTVDVNEANHEAVAFYERVGFVVIGRSPTDGEGRPYPLLHMRREAVAAFDASDRTV